MTAGAENSSPRIVPAGETDLAAISQLAGVIWRAHYPGIISAEQIEYMLGRMYALETLREDVGRRGIRYDRLLVDEDFVGFVAYGPDALPETWKLHKLYLRPEWHGRGWGSLLLRHGAAEAAKVGARRLILTVNKKNTQALATYERNGFTVVDAVVTDIGGGFVMDDYVLARNLDPRDCQ
jgi:GNAT superfamily N-acetyltransferase